MPGGLGSFLLYILNNLEKEKARGADGGYYWQILEEWRKKREADEAYAALRLPGILRYIEDQMSRLQGEPEIRAPEMMARKDANMTVQRRAIKKGEALALYPSAIKSGPEGIWWDMITPVPANERCGSVAVVHIRGSLEHHANFGGDSYDGILARVTDAMEGGEDGEPSTVVLRLDSPGGVVSGLNETVFALRKLSAATGIPLVAYVDELAASAAYALACSCDEIVMPPSAIAGSVGVISTLYDQVGADKKMGINFVTLTSGARKADGHPHVPVSPEAMAAEQRRVDKLAKQFYRIVAAKRPLTPEKIASYEAGIFMAKEAVAKGLADVVMGWDEMIASLDDGPSNGPNQKSLASNSESASISQGSKTAHRAGSVTPEKRPGMYLQLKATISRTENAIAKEKDPKKRKALISALANFKSTLEAYKKEKKTIEKYESEEDEESSEESEEESEESEEESEEAKGNETDRKENKAKADDSGDDDDDDSEEDDEDEEDEEDEEAAAKYPGGKKAAASLAALAQSVTGKKGIAAVGALSAMIEQGQRAAAAVAQIEKERRAEKKAAKIDSALNARRITKHEAKTLRGKPLSFVSAFLEMRPKAIVNVDDDALIVPDDGAAHGSLPANVLRSVEVAISAMNISDPAKADEMRQSMIKEQKARLSSSNGVAGRY